MQKAIYYLTAAAITALITPASADTVDTEKNLYQTVILRWQQADDIQARCDAENLARGYPKFKHAIRACAFWSGNVCTIFTKKMANLEEVGHEVVHCYQQNWH